MRTPNPQVIKINFPYLVHEIARACKVTRGTVRRWQKQGLVALDGHKPLMFLGAEVRAFLEWKRQRSKRPCGPGQIYCVRCRVPKVPMKNFAHYRHLNGLVGTLIGKCPDCECAIYRHVNVQRLELVCGELVVDLTEEDARLVERFFSPVTDAPEGKS